MSRIESNGVMLSVTDLPQRIGRQGSHAGGLPIVMVHGLAASSAFWHAAGAQALSILGRTVLYDLRGHGKSAVPDTGYGVVSMMKDLEGLLAALGLHRYHLVAHSFGGMIALAHALKHPDEVASLTLADVRVRPIQKKIAIPVSSIPEALAAKLAALGIDIGKISQSDDGVDYLRTVARIELEAGEESGALLAAVYKHPRLFRNRRTAERWVQLCERVSLVADLAEEPGFTVADLAQLKVPMLILVGGRSTTLPSARELAQICKHAIFKEVPDVGHFFPVSQPRLFLGPTMRFIRAVNDHERRQTFDGAVVPAETLVPEQPAQIEVLRPAPAVVQLRVAPDPLAELVPLRRASGAS